MPLLRSDAGFMTIMAEAIMPHTERCTVKGLGVCPDLSWIFFSQLPFIKWKRKVKCSCALRKVWREISIPFSHLTSFFSSSPSSPFNLSFTGISYIFSSLQMRSVTNTQNSTSHSKCHFSCFSHYIYLQRGLKVEGKYSKVKSGFSCSLPGTDHQSWGLTLKYSQPVIGDLALHKFNH